MNELIVKPEPFSSVTLTGTGANPDNIGNERLGRTFSWAGAAIKTLVLDLGSAKPIDVIAPIAHDLGADSRFRVYAAASAAALAPTGGVGGGAPTGATTYASGYQSILASAEGANRVHRRGLLKLDEAVTARYWRVDIDAKAAGSLGRLVMGEAFQPLEGRDYGWDRRVIDLGERSRSRTGLSNNIIRPKVFEFSWNWTGLTEEEATSALIELQLYAGITRDILVVLDYTHDQLHNMIAYGQMTEPNISTNWAENWHELQCQLESRLVEAI